MQTNPNERYEMMLRADRLRGSLLLAADIAALVTLAPNWSALGHHLVTADAWVATVGADQAAASITGAALWLCAAWLGVVLAVMALSRAPGWLGPVGRRLTRLIAPAAAVRVIAGIAGLSISLGVIAPAAALAGPIAGPASSSSAPAWPMSPIAPSWPLTTPGPLPPPAATPAGQHVVAAGDCLWSLAAAQLGPAGRPPQIATLARAWYAANRAVIGPDPALLHPGQLLVEPGRTP
jgi:nucleoid-associated protein YgaU